VRFFTLRKGFLIFERKGTAEGVFEARALLQPVAPHLVGPKVPIRTPEFITPPDFFRTSWWARLGIILSRYPVHLTVVSSKLFRDVPVRPRRFTVKTLVISVLLHTSVLLLLPIILRYLPFQVTRAASVAANDQQVIYYHLANPEHREKAPKILPPGPGSAPGTGSVPEEPALRGATLSRAALFAVSRPRIPDNNHQTILQPLSPPDLKIKVDLNLPNLVMNKPQPPKATLKFNPSSVKPLERSTRDVNAVAPTLVTANVPMQLTDALIASNDRPKLAVPLGAPPAPNMPSRSSGASSEVGAPELDASGTPGQGLLILGTSPGNAIDLVSLPQGNRYGQFSIAPGGNGAGSPGGQPNGSPSGGSGGGVGGGNDSTGVGPGTSGGGGGSGGTPGIVSIRGTNGGSESLGSPEPEHVVFAMPKISGPRHNALMVAAGPMGGGGLDVYGALRCGKIYTVFLPANGKGWTLQFCQTPAPGAVPAPKAYTNVVHLEQALVPPEAETRFDFKRTPLPPEKLHKSVILKGRIGEDGVVTDLKVFQGLSTEMDAAAKLAFSKWTFKPAMKSGKSVSVDILVGIPSDAPKASGN
jgi:uncharacterized membrane protein YgcG